MSLIPVVSVLLVFIGATFLLFSIFMGWGMRKGVPDVLYGKWTAITGLMAFFLAGYLAFLVIRIRHLDFPLELVTGIVFFGGAIFVFLVMNLTQITISKLQESHEEVVLAYDSTIEGWSRALELRDEETEGHTQRVTEMTMRLALEIGMDDEELAHVRRGALLHDIGKMAIPDSILMNSGVLTEEERLTMECHPAYAYELLKPISYLRPALDIPYCHHEKWDGSGYPRGLVGEGIPLSARVFAIVDIWDALSTRRRYHAPWPREKVVAYINSLSGSHFDPRLVKIFLNMVWFGSSVQSWGVDNRQADSM